MADSNDEIVKLDNPIVGPATRYELVSKTVVHTIEFENEDQAEMFKAICDNDNYGLVEVKFDQMRKVWIISQYVKLWTQWKAVSNFEVKINGKTLPNLP